MSTLKIIPPELPVTKSLGKATQSTVVPIDADGFVDLKRACGLLKGDLQSRQPQPSKYRVVQPNLQNQHGLPPLPQMSEIKVFNKSQLLEAMYKIQQQQQQQQQQILQTELPDQQLPDPLSALQHQQAFKSPAWRQDKVTPPDQGKAFNTEGPTLPESRRPVDEGFDCLKMKDSTMKPLEDHVQPSDTYQEGKVQLCCEKGLKDFLLHGVQLRGTTGVLLNDRIKPDGGQYEVGTHYNMIVQLGAGSFGTVDLCVDSISRQQFVRKQLRKASFNPTEVYVPAEFPHENITHMLGIISYPDSIELLIEYAGTSLNRFVANHRDLWKSEKQMWNLVRQGFRALAHLEKYGITHLDIKPENLCILTQEDESLVLKLTDFGSAHTQQESLKCVGMTPEYLAPEFAKLVLQQKCKDVNFGVSEKDVTCKVDVFAFGLVIMYIYKGYHILLNLITKGQTSYANILPNEHQRLQTQLLLLLASDNTFIKNLIPDECSLEMRGLISDLVQHDHQRRPAASAILQRLEQVVKPERARQEEVFSTRQVNCTAKYFQNAGKTLPEQCMEVDSSPVRHATQDLLPKKISNHYPSGKGFKCQGKGKGLSRGSTVARQFPYRGRPVASKVMDNSLTPVEEMRTLCIEEQPVQGVTDSHAPVAQASMETKCTNDCEFIDDNAPMANIQACLIPQFHQTSPFPQTVQAYTQASNVQDVDLRRPVSSPQNVQTPRPQTLQTMGQAASRTTRLFTELDVFGKLLDLRAKSQVQEMTPESPPNPQPTAMNQDCPEARLPCFDMLFS